MSRKMTRRKKISFLHDNPRRKKFLYRKASELYNNVSRKSTSALIESVEAE